MERDLSSSVVKSSEVIGVNVKNDQMEDLGEVNEIVLDKVEGITRYVVLDFNGLFGLANKFFALPWKALHYNKDKDCFIVNIDKEKLKNAPGFDKDNWPNMADASWQRQINTFYGIEE